MGIASYREQNSGVTSVTIIPPELFDYHCMQEFQNSFNEGDLAKAMFVIDMRNTRYMDSSALGMLLSLHQGMKNRTAEIRIVNCDPQVRKLFMISHFDRKFVIE